MTTQQKVSQRKQVKSAIERIDSLEGDIQRLFTALNETSMVNQRGTTELASVVEAVIEILGTPVVDAKIEEISQRKKLEALDRAENAVKVGLENGDLVKAEAINETSLVVGREIDEKGEVVFPGKVQLQMSAIKPEFQEKLKGQGAGTVIDAPRGKFEVLAVYDVVQKPAADASPTPAPTQAPTTDAAPVETVEQLESALKPVEA